MTVDDAVQAAARVSDALVGQYVGYPAVIGLLFEIPSEDADEVGVAIDIASVAYTQRARTRQCAQKARLAMVRSDQLYVSGALFESDDPIPLSVTVAPTVTG